MFNIAIVMHLFNQLVIEKYPNGTTNEPSPRDYEIVDQLMVVIGLFMNSAEVFQGDVVLDVDDYGDDDGEYMLESNDDEKSLTVGGHSYSYKTMLEIVEFSNEHQFSTVQCRYRLIKQRNQLKRIRKYVKQLGTKRQKLEKLDQFVFDKFNKIRNKSLPIHDHDLNRLAMGEAKQFNLEKFRASLFWILNFKRRHQILSRKVTKIVTKNHDEDREQIMKQAKAFVHEVKQHIPHYKTNHILNADQSSFNYENFSTPTLSTVGEKTTKGRIIASNAFTHSHIIMLSISFSGETIGPVFICLQEPTGKLGPRVLKSMYKARKIHITCSKSGKLTKSHIQYGTKEVLQPYVEENFLLLLDSWSGQTD